MVMNKNVIKTVMQFLKIEIDNMTKWSGCNQKWYISLGLVSTEFLYYLLYLVSFIRDINTLAITLTPIWIQNSMYLNYLHVKHIWFLGVQCAHQNICPFKTVFSFIWTFFLVFVVYQVNLRQTKLWLLMWSVKILIYFRSPLLKWCINRVTELSSHFYSH